MIKTNPKPKRDSFNRIMLQWYKKHGSSYPWRLTKDPYQLLISEILLRKTTRKQVESLFKEFFETFPTLDSLAKSSNKKIKKIIKPLGMEHVRSRLLKDLSTKVQSKYNGILPLEENDLLELPGIGQYACNAVLCFTKNRRVPMIDTNSIRVLQRVFDISSINKRPRNDSKIWKFAFQLLPAKKFKEFNLSLLDFASMVCLPKNPRCSSCPVRSICKFYESRKYKI